MIDVAALASYVIYREHHPIRKTKDHRRQFLKELSKQLCFAAIEKRSTNKLIMRKYFVRSAVEMVLKGRIIVAPEPKAGSKAPYGSRGASPITERCYICQCQKHTQRKTRHSCIICMKPERKQHAFHAEKVNNHFQNKHILCIFMFILYN